MSCRGSSRSGFGDSGLARQISRFIGETVTIFTTSGGASGCGFTGVVLSVNGCFVRLVTDFGMSPTNPLSDHICRDFDDDDDDWNSGRNCTSSDRTSRSNRDRRRNRNRQVGSVCDIPIDRIAAFCHNAV